MTDLNFFLIQRFNTQPRGGGCFILTKSKQPEKEFQHTAARRRLLMCHCIYSKQINCFNTQPRGGGCTTQYATDYNDNGFNTQPRGGGC